MDWSSLWLCTLYLLRPCTAYDLAFVSTATVIRYYNLTDFDGRGTYIPVKNASDIIAVDYDPYEGYVFWADITLSIISRTRLNGTDEQIIHHNLRSPSSLAIDGESGMMYWTEADEGMQAIKRSCLNGSRKQELIQESLGIPWSLVLDTKNGKMYWTDIGSHPRIERANLDGSERKVLVDESVVKHMSLTLDLEKRRIYWVDRIQNNIMYSDLEGQNPTELLSLNFEATLNIAVYGDTIFWCDGSVLVKYDQDTGDPPDEFLSMPDWDLHCLKSVTTNEGKEIMLACEEQGMREFDLTVEKDLGRRIGSLSSDIAAAVDYNAREDKIYWIDMTTSSVKAAYRNGSGITKLADTSRSVRAGLSIDLETDQLFWSERPTKVIRNMNLNGQNQGTYKDNLGSVTTLTLDTTNKYVYWIEYGRTDGKINRALYNGSDMTTLLSALQFPGAIVVDASREVMYWNEYKLDMIVVALLDGTKVGTILAEDKIRYMTISGNTIYWYSLNGNIGKVNSQTRQQQTLVLSGSEVEFRSIKIFPSVSSCEHANCINGGTCKSQTFGFSCLCAAGYTGRNCEIDVDDCIDVTCLNNGTCVDNINSYKCNCAVGFVGVHCESDVDECQSNPCRNNALCVDDVSKYHCICRLGFVGDQCETGLGFLVVAAVVITLTALTGVLVRKRMYQRRTRSSLAKQGQNNMFSLVHLPSVVHDQMYRPNDIILG